MNYYIIIYIVNDQCARLLEAIHTNRTITLRLFQRMWLTYLMLIAVGPATTIADTLKCRTLINSGDSCYIQFDNSCALNWYSKAREHCHPSYETTMKMTRAYIDLGREKDTKSAMILYSQALVYADTMQQTYPDSAQSYFLKALAAANIARLARGFQKVKLAMIIEDEINAALLRDSTFAPSWVLLGGYYREVASAAPLLKAFAGIFFGATIQGSLTDAERSLRKALDVSPTNVYAHLELARTMIALNRNDEAIFLLKEMQNLTREWHYDNNLKTEGLLLLEEVRR